MASVRFEHKQYGGSVEVNPDSVELFKLDASPIRNVPEAGGDVNLPIPDAVQRIRILAAALHSEITNASYLHPESHHELTAALSHAEQAGNWAHVGLTKNQTLGLQKAPLPQTPFPPRTKTLARRGR